MPVKPLGCGTFVVLENRAEPIRLYEARAIDAMPLFGKSTSGDTALVLNR
jgi:hypothetical protein